jgi:hypothetical protein
MRATTSSQPTYRGDGALEHALGNAVGQVLRSTLVVLRAPWNLKHVNSIISNYISTIYFINNNNKS